MKKLLLILPLIYLPLFAKIHTLKEITAMPQSISKDFYIWRFITESNTTKEASLNAYQQSLRKSYKLKKAIRQKLGYLPKEKTKNAKDPKNFIIYPICHKVSKFHTLGGATFLNKVQKLVYMV